MAGFTVLLDACVLYPAPIRDLCLRLAEAGMYRVRWTQRIHEEWINSLLSSNGSYQRANLERTRQDMDDAFPEAEITGFEPLIDILQLPDPNDRHVLAAAINCKADAIVTFNLKDFPADYLATWEIEAIHPDVFFGNQFDLSKAKFIATVKQQRESLKRPPYSVDDFLNALSRSQIPNTVQLLRPFELII